MRTEKISNLPFYMKVTQKKTNGIVYTPRWIVDFILDGIEYKHNIYNKKTDSPSVFKGYKNDICLNDKYVRNS